MQSGSENFSPLPSPQASAAYLVPKEEESDSHNNKCQNADDTDDDPPTEHSIASPDGRQSRGTGSVNGSFAGTNNIMPNNASFNRSFLDGTVMYGSNGTFNEALFRRLGHLGARSTFVPRSRSRLWEGESEAESTSTTPYMWQQEAALSNLAMNKLSNMVHNNNNNSPDRATEMDQELNENSTGPQNEDELNAGDLVQLHDAITEERIRREDFLIRVAQLYRQYGCPAYMIERQLCKAARGLGLRARFVVLPSVLLVAFGNLTGSGASETLFVEAYSGFEFAKLEQLDYLVCECASGEFKDSIMPAIAQLDTIMLKPLPWSKPFALICYAFYAMCMCIMFFGGSWTDAILGGALGIIMGLTDMYYARMSPRVVALMPFLLCMLSGFVGRFGERHGYCCYYPVAFSGITW
eukprot:PhM_4_TR1292/c0_g1_i4/m.58286